MDKILVTIDFASTQKWGLRFAIHELIIKYAQRK